MPTGPCLPAPTRARRPSWRCWQPACRRDTVSLLSRLLARNYDVALGKKDLELYLDRIEQSVPKSVEAGRMSEQELEEYLARLREKKQ